MLLIEIPEREWFDEEKLEFFKTKATSFQIEHSLVSLSKWESKWCKPFLSDEKKSDEELLDYIRCMTITRNVSLDTYAGLPQVIINQIERYINASMTATWFNEQEKNKQREETITSELIYYWMILYNIPAEYQKWHLNRLMTLIRICDVKNSPEKKKGRSETLAERRELNRQRREKYNTKG